jgi:hypothetical protein
MLQARVKQLEKEACEDTRHCESLLARLVPLVRKEVAEKEAAKETTEEEVTEKRWPRRRWLRRRTKTMRKIRPGHREAATTMAPSAPSDFPESSVSSSVPFGAYNIIICVCYFRILL